MHHSVSNEIQESVPLLPQPPHTKRALNHRHIQMLAVGGTIGTGLFIGTAATLSQAGAVGALCSLGEMATLLPVSGSFNTYAERFVDPALGFTSGWNCCWAITIPMQLISASSFLSYWFPNVPSYIWFFLLLIIFTSINCTSVDLFGEIEFWLSLLKVVFIVLFVCVGLILAFKLDVGFSRIKEGGGPFRDAGGVGVGIGMIGAVFAFAGCEIVGITASEAHDPINTVPKSINGSILLISLCYIASISVIGVLVPANAAELTSSENLVKSPFVIAFKYAGLNGAADLVNAVGLVAVLASGNSAIYCCARTLVGLSDNGHAPSIFSKVNERGVPVPAILVASIFGGISFLGTFVGDGVVFGVLVNSITLASISNWLFIAITHLRFRTSYLLQGFKTEDLPYSVALHPLGDIFSIIASLFVIVFAGISPLFQGGKIDVTQLLSTYILFPVQALLFFGFKKRFGTVIVPLMECDFSSGNAIEHDLEFEN